MEGFAGVFLQLYGMRLQTSNPPNRTARKIKKILVFRCLCLLLCFGSTAQESGGDETDVLELPTFSVLKKTDTVELKTGEQEFTVKYPPILRNTEQLTEADGKILVRNIDYQVDFYSGKITIEPRDAIAYPYKLKVTYRTLPFAIKGGL